MKNLIFSPVATGFGKARYTSVMKGFGKVRYTTVMKGFGGMGEFPWSTLITASGTTLSNIFSKSPYGNQPIYPYSSAGVMPSQPINWGSILPIALIGLVAVIALKR